MVKRSPTNKSKWFRWLRLGLGVAVLAYVLWRVDRHEAARVLAHANPLLLGSAFALTALAMVGITAYRWQRLVIAQAVDVPLSHLALYYLVGYFFNMFLPGSIGGDIYRVIKLGNEIGSQSGALASVVTERLLGLMALLPVGLVGFIFSPIQLPGQREFTAILALLGLLLLSAPFWLRPVVLSPFRPFYERLLALPLLHKLRLSERIARLYQAVSVYLDQPRTLLAPFALSLLSRIVWVAAAYLIGQAIGVDLAFYVYMAVLAITELVRMLPISLGGIGLREGIFVVLLAPFGVTSGSAFMLSLLFYLMLMGLGVVGGGIYLALGLRLADDAVLPGA